MSHTSPPEERAAGEPPHPDVADRARGTNAVANPTEAAGQRRLWRKLRRFAGARLHDGDLAQDVAQEAFARSLEGPGDTATEGRDRYLFGIARHVIADEQRRQGREIPVDPLDPNGVLARTRDAEGRTATFRTGIEARALLFLALARLDRSDRELIEAHYFDGLTSAEIADLEAVPAARIRKRKERALRRLRRDFLSDDG